MQESDNYCPSSVTYRFKNIGPISDAELELGNLTVIAGRNNTGKSYIVYTLYGFLKLWKHWPHSTLIFVDQANNNANFPDIMSVAKTVINDGSAMVELDLSAIQQQRTLVARGIVQSFSEQALADVFSSRSSDFEGASFDVTLPSNGAFHANPVTLNTGEGRSLRIAYDQGNVVFTIEREQDSGSPVDLHFEFAYLYVLFLIGDTFPRPFILSAERFGISLFYRELDFTKNQLVDLLQKLGKGERGFEVSPYLLVDRATSRYAMPIKDNIDYTRSIPDQTRDRSEVYDTRLFDQVKEMMDGYYRASGDDIRFISKARGKNRSFNIPLHLASSSARGLSDLYFFLRHGATRNRLLIIDEPEGHLDTSNQILLARLLARFVRTGLNVLITTHSDYLIKELNNLTGLCA